MALLGLFKQSPQKMACEIGNELSISAAYGTNKVVELLKRSEINLLGEEILSNVYLEVLFLEIHIVDKLMSNYYGSQFRGSFVNLLVNNTKANFMNTSTFSGLYNDSGSYFEQYFQYSFYSYPPQVPILGKDGETNTVRHFVDRVLALFDNIDNSIETVIKLIVYESFSKFLIEVLSKKSIKKFLK